LKTGAAREEVREALAKLDGLETIEAIPEGLDAEVGERGSGPSLEQSQLICFFLGSSWFNLIEGLEGQGNQAF
jgi:ABC-type multidrug transport system fused ATPase/permease subunit